MTSELLRVGNRVTAGNTRVSVLTERIVRVEYATDGVFEDRPTLAVSSRPDGAGITFAAEPDAAGVVVDTGAITLTVARPDTPPTARTLRATLRDAADATWHLGRKDRGNLGGTRRTLDGWKGDERQKVSLGPDGPEFGSWRRQHLDPGLLSRGGWTVVDDSASPVLDDGITTRGPWPVARPADHQLDLYLLAHGTDHLGALREAGSIFGRPPLLPRAVLGYWYSRYFAYTDREVDALVDGFDQLGLPLDVLVIDMDWHLPRWTGYSWDSRYFPDPGGMLRRLHERGLQVTLNLHPADGVGSHEDAFEAMCADLDLDPRRTDAVPFDCTDPDFVDAYFRHLHHPNEDLGVDFWWMDWQQGKRSAVPGLDPLPWLNKLHWDDQVARRHGRRPMSFSRWGGLGSGRYPVGFSGDTYTTWDSLAYQPHFTATAANVLYGYWSHDIGGHYGPTTTPELMARWVQLGVYSPILRTHGSKDMAQERRVWEFPAPYREQMMADLRRRYDLIPYIYGACRSGIDDGRSLVRPMYHEDPDVDAAYEHPGQFWFGPDLIVHPVTAPVGDDESAEVTVWLPRGDWYDLALGEHHRVRALTGTHVIRRYRLEEVPVFARAGAVLPGQVGATRTNRPSYDHLRFTVVPDRDRSGGGGAVELYEDDGVSEAWRRGSSARTPLRWAPTPTGATVTIGAAAGRYRGWRPTRPVELRLPGTAPPAEVRVGRRRLAWSDRPVDEGWWWDAGDAATTVRLPAVDLRTRTSVRVVADAERPDRLLDGLPGLARRLDRIAELAGLASPHFPLHDDERLPVDLAQALHRVQLDPDRAPIEIRRLRREVPRLPTVLAEFAEAWRGSYAPAFMDNREAAAELLEQARRVHESIS